MRKAALACALFAVLLAGCSNSGSTPTARTTAPRTPTQSSVSTTPGAPGCQSPSLIQTSAIGLPEVQGTSSNASLWLLLFGDTKIGTDLKIVWRMTGTGDLRLVALGPQAQRVVPDWGPEAHGGSNWNRPGDEWGAGFTIPIAGCWDLHASRDDTAGDAWLNFSK